MTPNYFLNGWGGLIERAVDNLLCGCGACPQVVVGPVVWEQTDTGRRWYFSVATADDAGFRADQFAADDRRLTECMRGAMLLGLSQRRPIVLHDMGDELDMARLCAAIWPGSKTARIVADVEAERGWRHSNDGEPSRDF